MTGMQRLGVVVLCVGVAAALIVPPLLRGSATAEKASRSAADVGKEISGVSAEFQTVIPSLLLIADADFRKENAAKAIPVLRKYASLTAEMEKADPESAKAARSNHYRLLAMAAGFGDSESQNALDEIAKSKGPDAVLASSSAQLGRWIFNSTDPVAQTKVLDEMQVIAKNNSRSDDVMETLYFMISLKGANSDLTKRALDVMRANVMADGVDQLVAMLDARQALFKHVGKPIDIEGRTSIGGTFNLSEYKGKVVLLDFWATWCPPCVAEIPSLKKVYSVYHDKGFEIVGVNSDETDANVNSYVKEKEMPWVQLREAGQNTEQTLHPLAKKYGISSLPELFLVDRSGVVRYVDAEDGLEKKVAGLIRDEGKP